MAWKYKQKGSSKWWIGYWTKQPQPDGTLKNVQVLKSSGTSDEAEAERILQRLKLCEQSQRAGTLTQEFIDHLTAAAAPKTLLATALRDWVSEAESSASRATAAKYASIERDLNEHLPGRTLASVTSEQMRSFLAARRLHQTATTTNNHRNILGVFFRRCMTNGLLRYNPMAAVKRFEARENEGVARRSFTLDEVRDLHAKADPFWRYMVIAGFYTGQRLGDLASLQWGSVDFEQRLLVFIPRKTKRKMKRVKIPISKPLLALLYELAPRVIKPTDYLWPEKAESYRKNGTSELSVEFYELMVKCGLVAEREKAKRGERRRLSEVSFHCLRHTLTTYLKATGGSQVVAKEIVGHASDLVSDKYTHLPLEVLRGAVDALPDFSKR